MAVKTGDRIRLIDMKDEKYHPVPPGSTGTVTDIDDSGGFWVSWDGFSNNLKILPDVDIFEIIPDKILCFDLETTGLDTQSAEILQFAAVISEDDSLGTLCEMYRPAKAESWPQAQMVNGISPQDVHGKYPFDCEDNIRLIQSLIDSAGIITGYNIKGFDIPILRRYGVTVPDEKIFDVMPGFARAMKTRYGSAAKDRYKLKDAAVLAGIKAEDSHYHDALFDAEVTMKLYWFLRYLK